MAKEKFVRNKPHVNVGTIGHIDHGKTTLTAALVKVQSKKDLAKAISYKDIAKGGTVRDDTKTVTIAVSHVEYESDEAPLRARRLPGPRRLHQEHDHGRGADGRRDPGGVGARLGHAADARARASGAPGRSRPHRGLPEQVRRGRRPGDAGPRRDGGPRAPQQVQVRRRQRDGRSRRGAPGAQRRREVGEVDRRAARRARHEDPRPGPRHRQAVPDGGRGRVLDQGPRHGGHGPRRARHRQGGRRSRDRRLRATRARRW